MTSDQVSTTDRKNHFGNFLNVLVHCSGDIVTYSIWVLFLVSWNQKPSPEVIATQSKILFAANKKSMGNHFPKQGSMTNRMQVSFIGTKKWILKREGFVITCRGGCKLLRCRLKTCSVYIVLPRFVLQLPTGQGFTTRQRWLSDTSWFICIDIAPVV